LSLIVAIKNTNLNTLLATGKTHVNIQKGEGGVGGGMA
jgi:hypothetical protein